MFHDWREHSSKAKYLSHHFYDEVFVLIAKILAKYIQQRRHQDLLNRSARFPYRGVLYQNTGHLSEQ